MLKLGRSSRLFADHIVDTKIRFINIQNLNVCETFRGGSDRAAADSCIIYLSERERDGFVFIETHRQDKTLLLFEAKTGFASRDCANSSPPYRFVLLVQLYFISYLRIYRQN